VCVCVCVCDFVCDHGLTILPHTNTLTLTGVYLNADKKIVSVSRGLDTLVQCHKPDGELVQSFNSNQMNHNAACVSSDGTQFSVASKMQDVKIWNLGWRKKSKNYVSHALSLRQSAGKIKQHGEMVGVQLLAGQKKAFSLCRDGSYRLWSTDVVEKQDPPVVCERKGPPELNQSAQVGCVSEDGQLVAIASSKSVFVYRVDSAERVAAITNPHKGADIAALQFSPVGDGKSTQLLTAGGKGATLWTIGV
jgi:WD40 repeat protein